MKSTNSMLSQEELSRYQRHFALPDFSMQQQQQLKSARILCIGIGGIGCPLSIYLVAAGVGTLGIIDNDTVEISNLHRQILYTEKDIGQSKVVCAERRLIQLSPHVNIFTYEKKITAHNIIDLLVDYDLIIDGTDNFSTRYIINDACVMMDKPLLSASVWRYQAQLGLFNHSNSACYHCLFPKAQQYKRATCEEDGVIGTTVGIIATMAAQKAINYFLNKDKIDHELIIFDTQKFTLEKLKLIKDQQCKVCQRHEFFTPLDINAQKSDTMGINVSKLKIWLQQNQQLVIIDVREKWQRQISKIDNSTAVSFMQMSTFTPNSKVKTVIYCSSDHRSRIFASVLQKRGYRQVYFLQGGIQKWLAEEKNG